MWIPKYKRDELKGVDSPIPTQVVSNEEILPRPQNNKQQHVEYLIGEWGAANAKRLGMNRRDFMRSSMGFATAVLAMNAVHGNYWEVDAAEALEPAATAEKWPKGEYFIMDVQTHFTNAYDLGQERRAGSGGFSVDESETPKSATATASLRTVGGIDALLALQGEEGPGERRKRAVKRGGVALDVLDALKVEVLSGTLGPATLSKLKAVTAGLREGSGDAGLDSVLAEIELRVEVEIAKMSPRR